VSTLCKGVTLIMVIVHVSSSKDRLSEFCIILVYVNDINIIGNLQSIDEARNHFKTEFEMKDLGKTKFRNPSVQV